MHEPWHEKYVVAFEVAGEFGDVYHRGEIDLTLYTAREWRGLKFTGDSLKNKIRWALEFIGQPFIAYRQSMLYARPTALWRLDREHGHRVSVEIPKTLLKEERKREADRRRLSVMFSGDDAPH